jgi:hypothetical protein
MQGGPRIVKDSSGEQKDLSTEVLDYLYSPPAKTEERSLAGKDKVYVGEGPGRAVWKSVTYVVSLLTAYFAPKSVVYALTDAATIAVDWNNGQLQRVTLGGNRTFTFANPVEGQKYMLFLTQDGTGSRTVTWPTIKWRGGSAPTLSTAASKIDVITLVYQNSTYWGDVGLNFA